MPEESGSVNTVEPILNASVTVASGKRKIMLDYLFNFLMIFLAVFLGFIAENYREGLADQAKEREYIKSLIFNLQDDSARLSKMIPLLVYKHKGLDSIVAHSKSDFKIAADRRWLFLNVFKYLKIDWFFRTNNATLSQLKSSGDLRLLQKHHVADSIAKFDVRQAELLTAEVYATERHNVVVSLIWKITDLTYVNSEDLSIPVNTEIPPFTWSGREQIEFFNWMWNYSDATSHWANYLKLQATQTNRLIAFLKKEYST